MLAWRSPPSLRIFHHFDLILRSPSPKRVHARLRRAMARASRRMAASSNLLPWFETRPSVAPNHEADGVGAHSNSIPFQLVEAELAPALARSLLVGLCRPCGGRIARATKIRVGI